MQSFFVLLTIQTCLIVGIGFSQENHSRTVFVTHESYFSKSLIVFDKIYTTEGVYLISEQALDHAKSDRIQIPDRHALVLWESTGKKKVPSKHVVWNKANVSLHVVPTSVLDFAPDSPDQFLRTQDQITHRLHGPKGTGTDFLKVVFPTTADVDEKGSLVVSGRETTKSIRSKTSLVLNSSLPNPTFSFSADDLKEEIEALLRSSRQDDSSWLNQQRFFMKSKQEARSYLVERMAELGYEIQIQEVRSKIGLLIGHNIIATKTGGILQDEEILVTAHYDTMQNSPGADDNGTGVVGLLKLAESFTTVQTSRTLRFIFFDLEEIGLIGSKKYIAKKVRDKSKTIVAVFNLEMLGYDGDKDKSFHAISCDLTHSTPISALIEKTMVQMKSPFTVSPACTNRSDHASFWKYNIPATVISQNFFGGDGSPCYHKSCDKLNRIDFDYFGGILGVVANSIFKTLK